MTKPSAVVFDLGGVLITFDYKIAINRLAPRIKITKAELMALLQETSLLLDFESGKVSTTEFFETVRNATGYCGDLETFCEDFNSMFGYVQEMVHLHDEVRGCGFKTYVLSNTNEIATAYFRKKFPFFNKFDGYVLSYDPTVQALKPAARIYEKLEQLSGLKGQQLFYIDDVPEYVDAARARGWQAIVHKSESETRQALIDAGVLDRSCV